MDIKKIAILGAGNGGYMCAFDMAQSGYEVRIFDSVEGKLDGLKKAGEITLLDINLQSTGKTQKVSLVADEIKDAVKGADLILNPVPFFAVKTYAELAAPYIEEGQIVICLGKGGASLVWAKALKEAGNTSKVYLGDTNTLPYGASRISDTQVRLEARTLNLMVAAFPSKDNPVILEAVKTVFPPENGYAIREGANVIDTLLVDYNAITHTPSMICNAAVVYRGEPSFHMFGPDECPRPVVNLIEGIDRERIALGEALGMKQYKLEEEIRMVNWNRDGYDGVLPIYEAVHTPFLEVCEGPFKLDARHLTEDIPYGLVTYSSLGRLLGVPTPVCDAIITIAERLLEKDFTHNGRTIEDMGLDPGWTIGQIKAYLHDGAI